MLHYRTSPAILACTLLALTTSIAAFARTADPCKQMQRDLDREIDDLKADQLYELDHCVQSYGTDSATCLSLKDQQQRELEERRNDRARRLAGCNRLSRVATPFPALDVIDADNDYYHHYHHYRHLPDYCDKYPSRVRYPHKDRYAHGKDPDDDDYKYKHDPDKHDKHPRPPATGGGGFVRPKPVDTATGDPKRDHATSGGGHQPERTDSASSPSAHSGHSRNSEGGVNAGGGSHSGISSAHSDHSSGGSSHSGISSSPSVHSSGGGSSSASGGSSSASSHSSPSSSGSIGGGGASHSASTSSTSSTSSSPSSTGSHPK